MPRPHRRLRRFVAVVVVLAVVVVAAAAAYVATTPGVADAQARVDAMLAGHGATPTGTPPAPRLADAIVAVEDHTFYSDILVNIADGVGRAGVAALRGSTNPGGATIPQQLAKLLYAGGGTLSDEFEQLGLAVKLAETYPKPQILEMYLNAAYYGNSFYGDEAAAEGYFGLAPDQLDWAQASLLAGLPNSPTDYDPFNHLALARSRQQHVLSRLVATGVLTQSQATAIFAEPLGLR